MSSDLSTQNEPRSPEWVKDLIIYEIATKGFTSPKGPESGTFASLKEKLEYLQELGITGIWLTGHSLSDSKHFYNIWTQYACIEPDKFDPTLGTPEDFKALVDDAHKRGIKIFLDVITHGVCNNSPLIKKHPKWFKGGTWGMTDYNWAWKIEELDNWWVDIWTKYVTEYGVDGYRLDVLSYRPDLWKKVRHNAEKAGHPIVIFNENVEPPHGHADFTQRDVPLGHGSERKAHKGHEWFRKNVAVFYDNKTPKLEYDVEIHYSDKTKSQGSTKGTGLLKVTNRGTTADKVGKEQKEPDGTPDIQLTIEGVEGKEISNVVVKDSEHGRWQMKGNGNWFAAIEGKAPIIDVYIANYQLDPNGWRAVQLSCHDEGWEGFKGDNPYEARSSRSLFGYSFLFSGMIPIFMSGEEFDATFKAIPTLSPFLYGGKSPGKGTWLYGNMLQWDDLAKPKHKEMLEDVKMMIAIRKKYLDIIGPFTPGEKRNIIGVSCTSTISSPVPYVRWKGKEAVLVIGNPNAEDVTFTLKIPLGKMGMSGSKRYQVTNLMDNETREYSESDLDAFQCKIKQDKTKGGGLGLYHIKGF